ncbi:MAG TPA: alkaline phosphatase family protein [Blastocatellia bacterium]|nr:alkaline phosphatase family protein [Blastocatellia bacterium]
MKTVVIGLDGATFNIIKPLAAAGRLPVLGRLMREGSHAPLRSTILPNSFPGWASCTTGTSEGMHGIFSPFIKIPGNYGVRAMSGLDIMTRHIWNILGDHCGRSLLVNIPTTYPPEPLKKDGVMITGMLTPGMESDFTFPLELKEEMLAAVPAYIIEPARTPDRKARAEGFRHASDMHELAVHFLMDRGDWDFLMVVFSVLDRAQHDYWADMDDSHPRHRAGTPAEFRGFIHEMYERLDASVGRIVEKLPSGTRVFVVSDHGFTAELMEIRVNDALAAAGLLEYKSGAGKRKTQFRSLKEKVGRRLGLLQSNGNVLDKKVGYGSAFLEDIDWTRTRAYLAQDKGVWVNLKGREQAGIVAECDSEAVVNEARSVLAEIKSPDAGERVFERLMRRDEAFSGRFSERLPDLVMIPTRDEYVYNERPSFGEIVVPADSTTGTHSRDGIFIAWGTGVRAGVEFDSQPNLRDVAPMALNSLGCPLTEDMDGQPHAEIFQQSAPIEPRGSSYKEEPANSTASGGAYNQTEEADLRERLRALGYIE